MSSAIFVSCGEPSGVSSDIVLLAWKQMATGECPPIPFVYVGDLSHLTARATHLDISIPLSLYDEQKSFSDSLSVVPIESPITGTIGKPDVSDAPAVIESITKSVELVRNNEGSALTTLPIHKKTLYDYGFPHQGHTQFLSHLCGDCRVVMMLASPDLRVVPITIHIPLSEVSQSLSQELIIETSRLVADELKHRFGILSPRLAFAGLNPHAGEGGSLGDEEITIIEPALSVLRSENIDCLGILSADTLFHTEARKNYDVAMCMYHDQALIPAKTLGFHDTANITLGLPFIRTSPDHGTALDIAGTGRVNIQSFLSSLRMASELSDSSSSSDAD